MLPVVTQRSLGALRTSTAGVRALVLVAAVASLVGPVQQARAQANSDFMAYPKSLVTLESYARDVRQLTFNRMPGLSADYKLGPGDEIQVTVVGASQGPMAFKVGPTGEINLPPVGPVRVADLSAEEAESAIAASLAARDLVKAPQVLIYISAYEAKPVYVVGEVDRAGEYMMSQQLSAMDLIFLAGGLDFTAGHQGYLHRRLSGGDVTRPASNVLENPSVARPGTEVITLDLQPMKQGGVLSLNPLLKAGDVLVVPRRVVEVFYVIGDVRKQGGFEFPPEADQGLWVSQAIAWAGGPTKTAKMSDGILVRYEKDGSRRELPVNFAAILGGQQPDIRVRSNDVIFIPGSSAKTIGYGLVQTIPGIVAGVLVY